MISPRNRIIELIEQGVIPAPRIGDALAAVKVSPDGRAWRTFIDHLLLWLGGLSLAFAAVFFIAYNWDDLGRFTKFGMVEVLMVLSIAAYWKLGGDKMAGKVALLVASIFLGVLLALYGQTYQTGADPWQLFMNWALLMLPWALIGRFAAIWIVWIALINLTIVSYWRTFPGNFLFLPDSETAALWLLFFFNTLALATWEFLAGIWRWLAERWAVRLLAVGSGVPITLLALYAIFESGEGDITAGLAWVVWLVALHSFYRRIKPDLFMLAGGCLSGIVVFVSFFADKILRDGDAGSFLFLSLLVIGLGAGSAVWLKKVYQEVQS